MSAVTRPDEAMTYATLRKRLAQLGDVPVREFVREVRSLALALAILFALGGFVMLAVLWVGARVDLNPTVALPRPWRPVLWVGLGILFLWWVARQYSKSMLAFLYGFLRPIFKDKETFVFVVGTLASFGLVWYLADLFLPGWASVCVYVFTLYCVYFMEMLLDRVPELAKLGDERAHLRVELRRTLGEPMDASSYLDEEFLLSLRLHGLRATITDDSPPGFKGDWLARVTDERDQLWGSSRSLGGRFEVLARAWLEALRATAGE
jgi:hypothetical protein